jgi:uncharacterized protein YjbJ (UPF0337 family)
MRDRIRGKWEELKGRLKRTYGEKTADRPKQVEGAVQEGMGKVQNRVGKFVDEVKREDAPPPP